MGEYYTKFLYVVPLGVTDGDDNGLEQDDVGLRFDSADRF